MSTSLILRPGHWLIARLRLSLQMMVVAVLSCLGVVAVVSVALSGAEPFWVWGVAGLTAVLVLHASAAVAAELSTGIAALSIAVASFQLQQGTPVPW